MGKWQSSVQRGAQRAPYNAGVKAFNEKRPKSANPYTRGCREWFQWLEGFNDAPVLARLDEEKQRQRSEAS